MSDQTPPDSGPESEPTPEATSPVEQPAEHPAGSTAEETSTTGEPPAASPAADESPTTTYAAAPAGEAAADAPAKSGRGRLLAIIAAVVVLLLVVGGLAVFFLRGSDEHKITTPSTAGSMKRDTGKEKALGPQLSQAEDQFKTQGQGKGSGISYVKSAVYNQTDSKRGPAGALVFLGAKLKKGDEQSPSKWVSDKFTKQAKANGLTVTTINPGDAGGKAVCAAVTAPQQVAICAWATKDTIGELVPTVAGYDAKKLSKIMLDLRKDVETSQ